MAGDWIPFTKDLPRKPEVLRLADAIGVSTYELTGLLMAFWGWADDQTGDGLLRGLSLETLEAAIDVTPLLRSQRYGDTRDCNAPCVTPSCAACAQRRADAAQVVRQFVCGLVAVGWLQPTDEGVHLPNFNVWMGNSAKKRLQTAKRVQKLRSGVTQRALPRGGAVKRSERYHNTVQNSTENTPSTPPVADDAGGASDDVADASEEVRTGGKAGSPGKAPGVAQDAAGGGQPPRRPPMPCDAPERAAEARRVVEHYARVVRPEQAGRAAAVPLVLDLLLGGRGEAELRGCADRYAAWCAAHDRGHRHRQSPKTFYGATGDWQDFLAGRAAEAAPPPAAPRVSGHVQAVVRKLAELAEGRYRDRAAAPGAGLCADGTPDLPYYERRYWRELAEARRAGVELPWLGGREPAAPEDGGGA